LSKSAGMLVGTL